MKDSTFINAAARYGRNAEEFQKHPEKYDESNKLKKILEGLIAGESLKQSYEVFRGLKPYEINKLKESLKKQEVSGEYIDFSDRGFTAVTFNRGNSFEYAIPDESGDLWIYSSILDEGDPALFIGDENPHYLGFRREGEILLNRKTKYYILGEEIVIIKHIDGIERKLHLVAVEYKW